MNYYNEFDPKAAAWLRELIRAGEIPDGHVDERSILDVQPADLAGYTQCHFFSGIGGWSLALNLAGWPSTQPCGTGSCPCQPFSDAGKGLGTADERHLWPAFFSLIVRCRALGQRWTDTIFGEQVASKAALAWLDGVSADLESAGYACGAVDLCAAGVGAPQIRQRLYWVANASNPFGRSLNVDREDGRNGADGGREKAYGITGTCREVCSVADPASPGPLPSALAGIHSGEEGAGARHVQPERYGDASRLADTKSQREGAERGGAREGLLQPDGYCGDGRLDIPDSQRGTPRLSGQEPGQEGLAGVANHAGDAEHARERERERERATIWLVQSQQSGLEGHSRHEHDRHESRWVAADSARSASEAGHVSAWSRCQLIHCLDGKTRRIEPESFPLAHGVPGRVGLLRGYGNAIVPQVAAAFIEAFIEVTHELDHP